MDPLKALETELAQERASMLGDAGRKVEATLAALDGTDDRASSGSAGARSNAKRCEELIDEAATAVWYYTILREAAGMHDHKEAYALYGIPGSLRARVGVIR